MCPYICSRSSVKDHIEAAPIISAHPPGAVVWTSHCCSIILLDLRHPRLLAPRRPARVSASGSFRVGCPSDILRCCVAAAAAYAAMHYTMRVVRTALTPYSPPSRGRGSGGGVGENKKQSIVVAGLFSYWGGGRLWYAWVLAGQHMLVWGASGRLMSLTVNHLQQGPSPSESCRHSWPCVAQQGHELVEAKPDPWATAARLFGSRCQVTCCVQQGDEQPRVSLPGH